MRVAILISAIALAAIFGSCKKNKATAAEILKTGKIWKAESLNGGSPEIAEHIKLTFEGDRYTMVFPDLYSPYNENTYTGTWQVIDDEQGVKFLSDSASTPPPGYAVGQNRSSWNTASLTKERWEASFSYDLQSAYTMVLKPAK